MPSSSSAFRKASRSVAKLTLLVLISLILIGSGLVAGYLWTCLRDLPHIDQLEEYHPDVTTTIYTEDNKPLAELFQQKRTLVPLSQISPNFINALLATEDRTFYEHWGVDFKSIFRALIHNVMAGRVMEGGSTITQQLAKVLFLTSERSLSRKLKELVLTLQIEKKYTKDEILELYCNQIYLGSGAYGVESASRTYFGKPAKKLSVGEAAMLAALPKSPNRYSPVRNRDLALQRRNLAIRRMAEEGFITPEQAEKATKSSLRLVRSTNGSQLGAYFVEDVRQYVEDKYGSDILYKEGLNIFTSLNYRMQMAAEEAVREGLKQLKVRHKYKPKRGNPQAALVAIDPFNGYIRAMVGGADFKESKFNRVTQALRQPGSAFKPIIYTTAIQAGYTPSYIVVDEPLSMYNPATRKNWEPENFGKKFYGSTTLLQALTYSRNIVTIKLLLELNPQRAINQARAMGISSPLQPYPSLALGTFEVTPLELTCAYAELANGGTRFEPAMIRHITDKQGHLLEEHISYPKRVLSEQTAFIVTQMLQNVVKHGTGWRAKELGYPVAGKTGTTDQYTDAWFMGFSPDLVAGVWVGFDRKYPLGGGETGSKAASPIWVSFMKKAEPKGPSVSFRAPSRVTVTSVCAQTGMLAGEYCPVSYEAAFVQGSEPTETCQGPHIIEKEEEDETATPVAGGKPL